MRKIAAIDGRVAASRPVWLFSMDTEQFCAPPLTTGALKAYHINYGRTAADTDIALVHFDCERDIEDWLECDWRTNVRPRAAAALAAGQAPVFGFSCYTWNVAEFLDLARLVKSALPDALVVGQVVARGDGPAVTFK